MDSLNGLLYRSDAASIVILAGLLPRLAAGNGAGLVPAVRPAAQLPAVGGRRGRRTGRGLAAGTLAGGLMVGPMVRGNLVREVESGAGRRRGDSGGQRRAGRRTAAQIENAV